MKRAATREEKRTAELPRSSDDRMSPGIFTMPATAGFTELNRSGYDPSETHHSKNVTDPAMINIPPRDMPVFNATMRKFGAPQTIIHQYRYWSVMLRPAQLTLGSLVLAAHEPAHAFSELGQESFTELHQVTVHLESALTRAFGYDKLNYLMLMMVDPDVHFHVIPRYARTKYFNGIEFTDSGWPGAPDLGRTYEIDTQVNHHIMDHIISCWA